MARTVLRFVTHRITQHPDADVAYEAECLHCKWKAYPSTDSAAVDVECMSHTGRSNHRGFRRICTAFAMVVRADEDKLPALSQIDKRALERFRRSEPVPLHARVL